MRELREIAKSYARINLTLILETPQRPPRSVGQRKPVRPVTILPTPEAMDVFRNQEITKSRSVLKSKMREWYDRLVKAVSKPIEERIKGAYQSCKNKIMTLQSRHRGERTACNLQDNDHSA